MWTPERIAILEARWLAGATAAAIAEELGGASRNAVIGKAHRLGLLCRRLARKPRPEHRRRPKLRRVSPSPPPCGNSLRTLFELTKEQCHWPAGDGDFLFCGAAAEPGKPYCARHLQEARR